MQGRAKRIIKLVLLFLASTTLIAVLVSGTPMDDEEFINLCRLGTLQEIEAAIRGGANVNAENNRGETPLINAAVNNPDVDVIAALVQAGADVNYKNKDGETALLRYSKGDNLKPIWYIDRGYFDSGTTRALLMFAECRSAAGDARFATHVDKYIRLEVLMALINNAGADVNIQDADGMTPLMFAARNNSDPAIITALLKMGANPTITIEADGKKLNALDLIEDFIEENYYMEGIPAFYELRDALKDAAKTF